MTADTALVSRLAMHMFRRRHGAGAYPSDEQMVQWEKVARDVLARLDAAITRELDEGMRRASTRFGEGALHLPNGVLA